MKVTCDQIATEGVFIPINIMYFSQWILSFSFFSKSDILNAAATIQSGDLNI